MQLLQGSHVNRRVLLVINKHEVCADIELLKIDPVFEDVEEIEPQIDAAFIE